MKKIGIVTAGILALFCLSGCTSNKNSLKISPDQPLTKVGQYHEADSENPKLTLISIKDMDTTKKNSDISFKFGKAKLIKVEATKDSQLENDEGNMGIKLPKTYYQYQLDYILKNNSDHIISDEGADIILPNGKQLSTNEGAIDSLIGEKIQPHAEKDGFIQAKVNKSDKDKLSKFKFVTPELDNANGERLGMHQITVKFGE
ncbi:MAG: hypothetical protein Q4E15_09260 [Lactobacillus johnsonii]|uniref:hypothetical protein n=1 Tax=Limosilactobacillus reuteri TaxID=1598 RepID=UPI000A1EAD4E|nr:hypothetical protein [Limosilactobacillus reuteri]MDO5009071.1 hypothetical protein [Lactobacillus johnsonii]